MITTFWSWFWKGTANSKAGIMLIIKWQNITHLLIATFLLLFINSDPFVFASKALFPAASILVSMAVAWTARASTVLQDVNFKKKVISDKNPLEAYVYGYQLALLIIITMVVYVAIMAGGGIEMPFVSNDISKPASGFFLYLLLSFSIAQCWQVIDFSNLITLLNEKVRD